MRGDGLDGLQSFAVGVQAGGVESFELGVIEFSFAVARFPLLDHLGSGGSMQYSLIEH